MAAQHISALMTECLGRHDEILQRHVPPPAEKKRKPYFGANITLDHLSKAATLNGKALATAISLAHERKISGCGDRVRLSQRVAKHMQLTSQQMYRGVESLEKAGLVQYVSRGRGRRSVVKLLF